MASSEGRHTPGPLRVESSIYDHMAAEIVAAEPGKERGIAQIWQHENAMADATLYAAAPDMLAAAKALFDRALVYDGDRIIIKCDSHGDAIGRIADMRAAMMKAEAR